MAHVPKRIINDRERPEPEDGEVVCSACWTVTPEEEYPHDCGTGPKNHGRDDGAHYIGPPTTPNHSNDPNHI